MSNLYLRYRTSNLEKINELRDIIIENSCQVLQRAEKDRSLQLTSRLSRLKCSNCYYISYLTSNEPRKCLRCSSNELNCRRWRSISKPYMRNRHFKLLRYSGPWFLQSQRKIILTSTSAPWVWVFCCELFSYMLMPCFILSNCFCNKYNWRIDWVQIMIK